METKYLFTFTFIILNTIGLYSFTDAVVPPDGTPCGNSNSRYCSPQGNYNDPTLKYLLCNEGGDNGVCTGPNSNGQVTQCARQGGDQDFTCRHCKAYGKSCTKDSDCCIGFITVPYYGLPVGLFPFCLKTAGQTTGTCRPCLHDFDPCNGTNLASCRKLQNSQTTASCRMYGGGAPDDEGGHNPEHAFIMFPVTLPDPCTPEGLKGFSGGNSRCRTMISVRAEKGFLGPDTEWDPLYNTGYEDTYFCSCPDNATVGYSCQISNLVQNTLYNALPAGKIDNGKRCMRCGLKGNLCGGGLLGTGLLNPYYPCCDYHTCQLNTTSGLHTCVPDDCTLEGNEVNFEDYETECCGGDDFHRNDKSERCTNLACAELNAECSQNIDCCGKTTICKGGDLGANSVCQTCIQDEDLVRGCREKTDCCDYKNGEGDDWSFCYFREKCKKCIRDDQPCDDNDTCCDTSESSCRPNPDQNNALYCMKL